LAQGRQNSIWRRHRPECDIFRGRAHWLLKSLACLAIVAVCVAVSCSARASGAEKRVLILFPYENNFPGFFYFDNNLRSVLRASPSFFFDFYAESMDLLRFPDELYFEDLVHLYRQKYAGRNIDLIIAVLGPALDFLAKYKDELFPGTPVLYVDIDNRLLDGSLLLSPGAVVTGRFDFEGTLDVALGLHPDVRDVFVVSGESDVDRAMEKLAAEAFQSFGDRVRLHSLRGLPMERLLQKVSGLPEPSIVFFVTIFKDTDGKTFLSPQAASMISEKSNVPVYGMSEYLVGAGIVGGRVYSFERLGEKTAQSALRLLSGERPDEIPMLEERADRVIFDWRQLKRWGISEASLPPGSIIRNRDFSAWEAYRPQILGIGSVLILQSFLIGALVHNLRKRRQASQALIRGEERLRRAADEWKTTFDSIPEQIMVLDRGLRVVRANQAAVSFLDLPLERILGNNCCSLLCGKEKPSKECPLEEMLKTKRHAEREVHDDEKDSSLLFSVDPILDGTGEIEGIIHTTRDITQRRRAEAEAHRQMTELAHVTRVATMGELATSLAHEINQPLTAILANAQAAQRFLSTAEPDLEEVREILADIVSDDKRVSEVIRRMRALLKKQTASSEELDLNETVMECVALVRSASLLEGLVVTAETNGGPILVRGDRVQLQQVLFNLMVNGAGAMNSASRTLRRILLKTEMVDDRMARVSVSDSGTGIDERNVDRLFEPFFTTKPEGMGMGLSISRTIIRAHGGEMGAANNPGGGATFTFTLPICREGGMDGGEAGGQVGR
jgi:PAS domain S-box-containing protein